MVSILILLDYQFYQYSKLTEKATKDNVSILILLDYQFYQKEEEAKEEQNEEVSILILLDYQFYRNKHFHHYPDSNSFNPYSTGLSILSSFKLYSQV